MANYRMIAYPLPLFCVILLLPHGLIAGMRQGGLVAPALKEGDPVVEERRSNSLLGPYRVLDLTDEKGLLCGRILGDLGADVIKIEWPGGNPARNIGPFYKDIVDPEKSLYWMFCNASKRGITLNLETSDGRDLFRRLVRTAHFVIESFPPGYMDSLGLGYAELEKINRRIIITSVTPFGQSGPYSDFNSSDTVVWAMGGLMSLCGDLDRAPVRVSIPQAYFFGGLHGALGSMVAHYHRELSGEGQHVDVSIQQACILTLMNAAETWDLLKVNIPRMGGFLVRPRPDPLGLLKMRTIWQCKDGYLCLLLLGGGAAGAVTSSRELVKWANSEGMAVELKDYDWSQHDTATISQEERDRLEQPIASFLLTKTKRELFEKAVEEAILLVPVSNIKDLLESPQLEAREYWVQVEHPELEASITYPGAFVKLSQCPWRIWRRAPLIGEHNQEVYVKELGLPQQELSILKHANVI